MSGRPISPTSRSGGTGVATIKYDGRRVLSCGAGGRAGSLRQTGDLQHRPREPIHQRGFYRQAGGGWHSHLDGRPRPLARQRVHRAAVAPLEYEDIYLKGYADGREAKVGIAKWLAFYNHRRPHQALANRPPMAVWRAGAGVALGAEVVDMT